MGLIFGGLLIGYEPVGGDPDRIFRPIKAELAEALRQGRLPFWSERMGLGIPLVAESHVAAFYPPNWILYRVLSVSAAYRISMWLHCVAIAAGTFAYARRIGNDPWGSGLSAIAFPLCGFLTIHSSHEWAYQTMAYLPICLLAADHYAESGRFRWLAGLALLWGVQITIGHFQVQMWTGALALLTGAWRVIADRRPIGRIAGLAFGLGWAAAIAAVQLAPTWELAELVGQRHRQIGDLAYYYYPPGHWAELVVPGLFRRLEGGGEAPYWLDQQTTEFEAFLFVGTIPLILAIVGMIAGGRKTAPWRWIVPLSFALATMPRWWPEGFVAALKVPGIGYFRCPARYTAVTSLGLALLAGRGLDRTISAGRFRAGILAAAAFAVAAAGWAFVWAAGHPRLLDALGGDLGATTRIGLAAPSVALAFWLVLLWRRGRRDRAVVILILTAVELGTFYHLGGSTQWGWSVPLPAASPALESLVGEAGVGRVGGDALDNLPVRAALATASPYIGFPLLPPHDLLKGAQAAKIIDDPNARRWLRRYGVTHTVRDALSTSRSDTILFQGEDPALDLLAYREPGKSGRRLWQVVRLPASFPEARVALRSVSAKNRAEVLEGLSTRDALDEVWYLPGDEPPATANRARSARVVRWQKLSGEVEHDGGCDLVLNRAYYPGWLARVDDGPERPIARTGDGLVAVRLDGKGISRVSLRFRPNNIGVAASISAVSAAIAIGVLLWPTVARRLASKSIEPRIEDR